MFACLGNANLETVILPEGVTSIGNYAFGSCFNLKSVTLPSTLKTIGQGAFQNCTSLETIVLPEGLTTVGQSAFQACTGLKNVTFPSTLETVGKWAFSGCSALGSADLPQGITSIGKDAFFGCTGLKRLTLPAALTNIENFSFQDLTALETVIVPEGVTTIGASAFAGCANLKRVELPSTLKTIGGDAFHGCTSLTSIQLPEALETMGGNAFEGCGLTSVTIPAGITTWGGKDFANCADLSQVTLTPGIKTLGGATFYGCPKITSVDIPEGVISIEGGTFRGTGLTSVTIPKSVTYLGELNEENASIPPFGMAGVGDDYSWIPGFVVKGYAGTEAEKYANFWHLTFEDLTPPAPKPSHSSSGHSHRWDSGVVTVEPTELTGGLRTYTCKSCGATRAEIISANWAPPVRGETVTIGRADDSGDPNARRRVISSKGTDPDPKGGSAYPSTQRVEVDGRAVEFQMYALKDEKGNDTNYVKIRDVALTINGTAAQCNVDWADGYVTVTTKTAYKANGSEMKTPFSGDRGYSAANGVTMIDGEEVLMQAFILQDDKGGGYTYYKLRDLAQALGFNVGWSADRGVYVETGKPYDPNN